MRYKRLGVKGVLGLSLGFFTIMGMGSTLMAGTGKISLPLQMTMAREPKFPIRIYLKSKPDFGKIPVLITEKSAKGRWVYEALRDRARQSQRHLKDLLDAKKVAYEAFYIVNMIAIPEATAGLVKELELDPEIERIQTNRTFNALAPIIHDDDLVLKESMGIEPGIVATGAPQVWSTYGAKGQGVVVAGQDTGVDYNHEALIRQYRGNQGATQDHNFNWYDAVRKPMQSGRNPCGFGSPLPCDDDTHGTHTMGTVVGDNGAQEKIGMAPEAQWIACRNMDRGLGQPSTYIRCFEFFLAPFPLDGNGLEDGDPEKAPDVINNSWGCPLDEGCDGQEMKEVLTALATAGITTVVSAGNAGPGCSTINDQPATHSDLTLSVGAYNHRSGQIAGFSSRGPSLLDFKVGPDITAPGVGIRSSIPGGYYGGGYSGTSMAGPHVAGAVALLISAKPELRGHPDQITEILTATASPGKTSQTCGGLPGDKFPNNTFGSGVLNIFEAVKKARGL